MDMPYVIWNVNGKEYRLRLTTLNAVQVEKQLKMGLTEAADHLSDPTVTTMLLWGGLQTYNHGMNFRDVCELYDEYIASGGRVDDIMDILIELLSQVGLCDKPEKPGKNVQSQEPDVTGA